MLWIAFNLLFSQWRKQQFCSLVGRKTCCELLSIYYFRSGENNVQGFILYNAKVVNCFQFIIFAVAKTTGYGKTGVDFRCELLSIYYFRSGENNYSRTTTRKAPVVNCFQFIIFAVAKTTGGEIGRFAIMLWIAFNLLFSQWRKQLVSQKKSVSKCCELLSIYYFRIGENNSIRAIKWLTDWYKVFEK